MAGERGTMILAMFCLSNDEKIPQMAEAYGGVGGMDHGDGRWVDKEAFIFIHQPLALLSSDPFSADLISTGRHLRKKCFGQSVTKGFIDTLPEAFS